MAIDYTKTILGRVKHIKIDSTNYPIEGTGATVTNVYEYQYRPIVGSAAPRVSVLRQYYRVDTLLAENLLATLKIAWNLPNAISSGANFDSLYMGLASTVTVHTLEVHGYVYGTNKYRRYIFNKACSFEPKPQQHTPTGLVLIPIAFFCYADETQTAGQEFGVIQQDT